MKKNGTKQQAAKAPKTHVFQERPTSLNGGTELACVDCGVLFDKNESAECPGVDLSDAPVLTAPKPKSLDAAHLAVPADLSELQPPAPQHLPFPVPPFDFERAFEQIESKRNGVSALETVWDIAKRRAKEAHDEYLEAVKELDSLIRRLGDEKRAAERAVAPRLVPAKDRPDTFAHVAGEPGEKVQPCSRCGIVLVSALDAGGQAYVVGTEIGEDCEPAETTDAPEAGESLANA